MTLLPLLANGVWWLAAGGEARRFSRSLHAVEDTQRNVLARILRGNAHTRYGAQYGFASIRNVEEYQQCVPLASYEDLRAHIEACAQGEQDVLFPGQPRCFELTSGSTTASKMIPYTSGLQAEFQAGIAPWVVDMFRHYPGMCSGSAYWSISPATYQQRRTAAGIPIGFEDDTAYLHPAIAWLLEKALAVPSVVAKIPDIDTFRYVTLAFLLRARNLRFISVWNPTFLTLLLTPLSRWGLQIADDLAAGTLSPPGALPPPLRDTLERRWKSDPKRADAIRRILSEGEQSGRIHYERLWPHLVLISAWAHAAAAGPARDLQRYFPTVPIAPKGLLATEGIVSIPRSGLPGSALALRSHFLEFLPEGGDNPVRSAWQLEEGARYAVILTTGGGLYRYQLGDVVQVVGFAEQCPLIEFVGKGQKASDLYGEKLHESHVRLALQRAFAADGLSPAFVLLAPDGEDTPDRYVLFFADDVQPCPATLAAVEALLEEALCENVHYAYCRQLGQLNAVRVCWVGDPLQAMARYQDVCMARGQQMGDIKPAVLDAGTGWRQQLCRDGESR
ncbi:MAG: GH3 auxin-responsive promoter family protein [Armatimonadota bacterium]